MTWPQKHTNTLRFGSSAFLIPTNCVTYLPLLIVLLKFPTRNHLYAQPACKKPPWTEGMSFRHLLLIHLDSNGSETLSKKCNENKLLYTCNNKSHSVVVYNHFVKRYGHIIVHKAAAFFKTCFQVVAIMNKTAVNFHMQVFLWTQVSNLFG